MFLNATMLVCLGAAVLPLVLHLLSRSRYKDVEWGAMLFLEGMDNNRQRSAKITQWVLLAMRSALIALLAVAMARPILKGKWASQYSEGGLTATLLLDCSAGMGFDENGRTRFQMAQAAARQIVRNLRPGDRISLILMGASRAATDLEPTGDLRAIESRIDEARTGYSRSNIADSLDLAADILRRHENSTRDVYIVTDHQAQSWQGIDDRFAAAWNRRVNSSGSAPRIFVFPVGSAESDNVAVESVRLLNAPAIVGQPAEIEAIIRNYGPVQHSALPVTLDTAGLPIPERSINLAPHESAAVNFTVTYPQSGSTVATVRQRGGGYTGDDQLDLAINVIPPIRVLVVSGADEHAGQSHADSDFLRWALMPHRSAGALGLDPCATTVISADALTDAELAKNQVVVLANVEQLSPSRIHSIEKYVYSGGAVLIAPGSLSRIDNYNAQFYRDGAGLIPAQLLPPTAADGSEATALADFQLQHPAFRFLRDRSGPGAPILRYFPTIPRQVDADVLAHYANGDPFLIEGKRGRVLLMTTALDADWSSLPITNFYLPFVQSAIRYLAASNVANANLTPGVPIRMAFDDPAADRSARLTRPDGKSVKLDVVRLDKQATFRYVDTETPGIYRVQIREEGKAPQAMNFAVRPPRDASDLTQLTDDQWSSMEQRLKFTRVDPAEQSIHDIIAADREGRELRGMLLGAVIALALLELIASRLGSIESTTRPTTDSEEEKAASIDHDPQAVEATTA